MARPFKNRMVSGKPGSVVYKPAGVPARVLQWVVLGMDEFESIRLLDHDGLSQEQAAEAMSVSRPTVTRVYSSARKKIAEALTEGKAVLIEGGPVDQIEKLGFDSAGRGQHRRGDGNGRGRRFRGRGN